MSITKLLIIPSLLLTLSACASLDTWDETRDWSAQKIYNEAKSALNDGDYDTAIKYYEILESREPFSRLAQQAHIETIYAYYKGEEPESALVAVERFIATYPDHPNLDYVYYLEGLVNFEINHGILDRFIPLDKSQRDAGASRQAFQSFSDLIALFPNSKYVEDARQRMLFLRNSLAQHELHVAEFYMHRGAYLAAANRAKTVIQNYQNTPSVPDALVILAKTYKIMGMNDLSVDALRVLEHNYPDHSGIQDIEKLAVR